MSADEIKNPATVFIVDDDPSICDALANLLDSEGIPQRAFNCTEDFLAGWRPEMPGCLLLDVRLPGMTGVEFQERLSAARIRIPIIFMTAHADVPMVRRVMKAGAIEFLTKPFQREELLDAVQAAFDKDSQQRRQRAQRELVWKCYSSLSPREKEVMSLVVDGLMNKQIAATLSLQEITVKFHRRHVMDKMRASSIADLVRMAEILKGATYTKA